MDSVFSSFSETYDKKVDEKILNASVSYDTSCLLNLYRCTESSREELLKFFNKVDNKFNHFLTHHVALEFSYKKNDAKKDIEQKFNNVQSSYVTFKKSLKGSLKLDGLNTPLENIDKSIKPLLENIDNILEKNKKEIKKNRDHEFIFDSVSSIFSKKVTSSYSNQELEKISEEGNKRFLCKIPPGFEDGNKSEFINIGGFAVEKKFGDLIIWLQLIDYSKANDKDLIFITADEKPDWFVSTGGMKKLRPDLAHEFFVKTNKNIFCYSLKEFERKFKKHLDFKLSVKAKNELAEFENESNSWLEDILIAFENFDGEATLKEIYRFIQKNSNRKLSTNWEVTIRRTIYNHSSDVNAYLGKADLFEKTAKGKWKKR